MSRSDMDAVPNDGIESAVHLLQKRGEFYPFSVVRTVLGEQRHVQTVIDAARSTSDDAREFLEVTLEKEGRTGVLQTVAMVSNVTLTEKDTGRRFDAIRVEVDDAECEPALCYVPYRLHSGAVELEEMEAGLGRRIVFGRERSSPR
ncbi:MAG: hypothetical protein HY859_05725 [Caulobacterales bacterium]|nr:hypothetical protein [Caulobacterales bacterium]